MDTNLPSLNRYYSLNRNRNINNLDIVNHNNRNNFYCTMSHRGNHLGNNVTLILPPTPATSSGQFQEMVNLSSNSSGQESKNVSNYEGHYNNVSSTSDYNTISVSDESSDNQTLIKHSGDTNRLRLVQQRIVQYAEWVLVIITLLSPIIMISVPKMLDLKHSQKKCSVGCEGILISIVFKLSILALCQWSILNKSPFAFRINPVKLFLVSCLVLLLTLYWILYFRQFYQSQDEIQISVVINYVSSFVTSLLYLHYLSVLVLVVRPVLSSQYVVHIVRGEDGVSHYTSVVEGTVQEAAQQVVRSYYQHFSMAVPNLNLKHQHHLVPANGSQRLLAPNNKHKQHLVTAVEDGFARLVASDPSNPTYASIEKPCDKQDLGQVTRAIFPNIYKHLLKYLKSTGMARHHTMDSIMDQLATYIKYGMSPQSFVSQYFHVPSVIQVSTILQSHLNNINKFNFEGY